MFTYLAAGAFAFLIKPCREDVLAECVDSALQRRQPSMRGHVYLQFAVDLAAVTLLILGCGMGLIQSPSANAITLVVGQASLGVALFLPVADGAEPVGAVNDFTTTTRDFLLVIALLTWVNLRGLREAKWIQTSFTIAKTGALAALILLGITIGRNADAIAGNFGSFWQGSPGGTPVTVLGLAIPLIITAFGSAMVGSLFSSDAWNNVTFAAAEVRRPERNLPLALALGTGLVTALYVLANFAYLSVLTLSEIKTAPQDRVGTLALEHMFGPVGQYLRAGAILISTAADVLASSTIEAVSLVQSAGTGTTGPKASPRWGSPRPPT